MQTTLHPGTIVRGRYLIEQQLGEGSGGGIYLTKDLQVKQKRFALFVLKEIITASKQERYHFTLSAVALTKLTHPSLPRIIRAFSDDKYERAYLLIEYIEGESLEKLRQVQKEKRWNLSEVVAMMEPIIDAISYLHKQDAPIIHRNIAPANIIMSARGNGHLPVLINPGVPEEQAVASQVGSNGLLNYEAPELYSEGASIATDIYALGATCYTLLTGIIPADAFYRSAELENETDPLAPVDEIASDLPQAVADAIHCAMAMNSQDRFASAEQFGRALKAAQPEQVSPVSKSVSVVPVRTPVVAAKSMVPVKAKIALANQSEQSSRQRLVRLAILLILLLVIGGSTFAYVLSQRAAKPVSATTAPLVTATIEATRTATHMGAAPSSTPQATSVRPTATSSPTAPTPSPTITSATYPQITGSYAGTILDQDGKTKTNLLLTHVRQNQGNLQGDFSGLQLQGPFRGTVDSQGNLQLTVANSAGNAVLFLEGAMQSSDSLSGDYYPCNSAQGSQCKRMTGGGVWNVIHA